MAASLLIFFRSNERIWDARSLFFHDMKRILNYRLFESVCLKVVDELICVSNGMRDYLKVYQKEKLPLRTVFQQFDVPETVTSLLK